MKTKKKVVCILTAGKGSRMGPLGTVLNKSLFVYKKKAIITHIIDKFSKKNTKFIIGIGFNGDQVKSFLKISHPENDFTFVKIKKYQGEGSGPGYSLFCCRKYLQQPFYFISCDTIINNKIPSNVKDNWLGVNKFNIKQNSKYCNLDIHRNKVKGIIDKKQVSKKNFRQFIGLCFIKNFKTFWKSFSNTKYIKKEIQISNGLEKLVLNDKVIKKSFDWLDLGNLESYKQAILKYERYDFSKSNECIYFYKNRIIKFFEDSLIIKNRIKKIKNKHNIFPIIDKKSKNFYSYKFLKGEIFYKNLNEENFLNFLRFSQKRLWIKKNKYPPKIFQKICTIFYKYKTLDRLKNFKKKYPFLEENKKINNKTYPNMVKLLSKIKWSYITKGIQSFIHGDLQFDNVIYDKDKKIFKLIDWRQDFAKSIDVGDLYYDLAKIYGGMLIDYSKIKQNKFQYFENKKYFKYRLPNIKKFKNYEKIFFNMLKKNNYDEKKVKILTGIIFLNMSPLHHYPFDKILYNLARKIIYEETL